MAEPETALEIVADGGVELLERDGAAARDQQVRPAEGSMSRKLRPSCCRSHRL